MENYTKNKIEILGWAFKNIKENIKRKYDFICDHDEDCQCSQEARDKVMLEEFLKLIENIILERNY